MEIAIPEKVLFETNVYTVENDLKAKKGRVRITENRVLFESVEEVKIAYISGIKTLKIKRDEKMGFLIAGTIFLFASLALFSSLPRIDSFLSAVFFFILPTVMLTISFLLIYWWKLTRSYLLSLFMEFGKEVEIRSQKFDDLLEIANAIELVKMGAVKRLPLRKNGESKALSYL
ncbi:MAG: hypothetical protein ACK401_07925 [Archaeoglobaceae archaeon]